MRSVRAVTALLFVWLSATLCVTSLHATFSIVAVDPATGEVGGAGASCINNAFIINDLIEGTGAIHTQAYWSSANQTNARNRMLAGDSPQEIITWLVANDAGGFGCSPGGPNCNETHRQYGVVDLFGGGARSAGHTGTNNTFYANHISGPTYSIQGNILLDPAGYDVLSEMESVFLNTSGPLADRLMAALQAANVPGADTRCLSSGRPSISAFIKVVRIGDGANPYLELNVPTTTTTENPIDILQGLYDAWKTGLDAEPDPFLSSVTIADTFLPADGSSTTQVTVIPRNNSGVDLGPGRVVAATHSGNGTLGAVLDNGDGTYTASLTAPLAGSMDTIMATVEGSGGPVTLADQPTVVYTTQTPGGGGGSSGGGCTYSPTRPMDPPSAFAAILPYLGILVLLILMRIRAPRTRGA